MAFKIIKDGFEIFVLSNKVRFKNRNPLLHDDVTPKEFTFPFKIPLSGNFESNRIRLGFPEQLNSDFTFEEDIDVFLLKPNGTYIPAVLRILEIVNDVAEVNLVINSSKWIANLFETPLNKFDFGRVKLVEYNKEILASRVWNVPPVDGVPYTYEIKINNKLFSEPFILGGGSPTLIEAENKLRSRLSADDSLDLVASKHPDGIRLTSKGLDSDNWFMVNTNHTDNEGVSPRYYEPYLWIQPYNEVLSEKLTEIRDNDDQIFCLPLIKNPSFFSETEAPEYVGYQNFYSYPLQRIPLDYISIPLGNKPKAITPMFYWVAIIRMIYEKMGLEIKGDFISHPDLQKVHFYSNRALQKIEYYRQLTTNYAPINVYPTHVKVAEFLPDMTVSDFLASLRSIFCLSFDYERELGVVHINFKQNEIEQFVKKDVRLITGMKQEKFDGEIKSIKFDMDEEDFGVPHFSLPFYNRSKTGTEIEIDFGVIYNHFINEDDPLPVPTIDIAGVGKEFGLSDDASAAYVLAYRGLKTIVQNDIETIFALSSSENFIFPYGFLDGPMFGFNFINGLYVTNWRRYLDFINNAKRYVTINALTDADVTFHSNNIVVNNGQAFLWKEIEYEYLNDRDILLIIKAIKL